jgi:hypothetical protein
MKLKLDENGNVVLKDGKPVYIDKDEKEIDVDVPALFAKVTQLNAENKNHRERNETLQANLEPFKDIEDIPKWKADADKAIEQVKNFTDKELVEAGKVEQIKSEMRSAHEDEKGKILQQFATEKTELQDALKKKDGTIYSLMVSAKFAQSPFFTGQKPKTLLTPEIAEAYFGKHFKVEEQKDGSLRVIGYMETNNPVYSRKNPGEIADFDEALESIIDKYPMRDRIMRAAQGGSGGQGGGDDRDTAPRSDVKKLQEQYDQAIKENRSQDAIAIKNRLFDAQKKEREARAA